LAKLCTAVVDCEHKTAPPDPQGQFFCPGTRDIKGGRLLLHQAKRVNHETWAEWTQRMVPELGDLILAREAPVGEVGAVPVSPRICLGQRTVLLRPDPDQVVPRYLLYLLLSPELRHAMVSRSEGSTVPHLNMSDIRALEVPIRHEPGEQAFIAESLGALDDKVDLNLQTADTLAELASALYRAAAQDSAEAEALGEVAEQLRVTVNPGDFPAELFDHFSIPAFDAEELPERVLGATIKSGKTLIDEKAVLISKLNPGKRWRAWLAEPDADIRAVCSTEFVALTSTSSYPLSLLAAALRFDPDVRVHVLAHVSGTTGSHQRIRPEDLLTAPVPALDATETERWLAQGAGLLELEAHLRVETVALRELRDVALRHIFQDGGVLPFPPVAEALPVR
jgi:type I restriction enzyme S subunit